MTDKELIKPLVDRILELAARPDEERKKLLWAKHNALQKTDKIRSHLYISSAARATKWLLDNMDRTGKIPFVYENGEFLKHERCDVLAQTLYLSSKLIDEISAIHVPEQLKLAKRAINKTLLLQVIAKHLIHDYQVVISDPELFENEKMEHGFVFGTDHGGKTKKNDVNAWCTIFAIKALKAYAEILNETNSKVI